MKFRFSPSSQISGRMDNTVVSIKCMSEKSVSQLDSMPLFANN
jgi:hypothetical protein